MTAMVKIGKLGRHKCLGYWYYRLDGKMKYLPRSIRTEEEARLAYDQIKANLLSEEAMKVIPPDQLKVMDLLNKFVHETEPREPTKHHSQKVKFIQMFNEKFGDGRLDELAPYQVKKWVEGHDTWGSSFQVLCYKHLSAGFNWSMDNLRTTYNPVRKIRDKPKAKCRGEEFVISPEEFNLLLDAAPKHWKPIFVMLWETGGRPEEILSATGNEFSEKEFCLIKKHHKNEKRGRDRKIPLSKTALATISAQIQKHGKGLLFPNKKGKAHHPEVLNQSIKRLRLKLKIQHPCIGYSFRHSFAVRHLERGVSIEVVAGWMGDKIGTIERHYAHTLERVRTTRHLLDEVPA